MGDNAEFDAPCGSCGEPTSHRIILRGKYVPACLRHTNHWRTPPADYTCPTRCVDVNHPGREHLAWLSEVGPIRVTPPRESA